jgi:hypothetical protein
MDLKPARRGKNDEEKKTTSRLQKPVISSICLISQPHHDNHYTLFLRLLQVSQVSQLKKKVVTVKKDNNFKQLTLKIPPKGGVTG